ncbi:MAG: hypothetical protein KZQ57_02340 [gamma proteobacterium symbiont of Lucinoma myriamae]|nr:hypothetical protein [gamma proteobacterium symbiont of Lucinoma myriamae]
MTNLQIQTNRIPNNLFIGEMLNVELFMTDNNKKITDDNFLQFISMSAVQKEPDNKRWFLHDNGLRGDTKAHDGLFNVQIKKTLAIGKNQFTFQASTDTLQREINYSVIIHDTQLINTRAEQIQKNNTNYHQILVTPNIEFVNPRNMKMSALLVEGHLIDNENSAQTITLQQANPKVLEWSYESDKLDPDKDHHVIIHMLTKTRTGRPVDYTSQPIQLNLPKFDNLLLSPNQLVTEETTAIESESDSIEAPLEEPEEETVETDNDWLMGAVIAVIVNIIFGIGGWFGYRKWKNNREAAYEKLTGELE